MQAFGIGPQVLRVLAKTSPALLAEVFPPGKRIDAEVVSVYRDRAVLAFGGGLRLEVALETALQEGQRVRLQVQPQGAEEPITLKLLQSQSPNAQPQAEAAQTPVVWLPIPLASGQQGWAQLQIQEQAARADGAARGAQVRLLWETPALGQVQVTLDAVDGALSTLFTVQQVSARPAVEAGLDGLMARLAEAGFTRVQAGCRQALPGDAWSPAPSAGGPRLDRRL